MLADDVACNPRNIAPGTVYSNADRKVDLYGEKIEVDYKGEEVNVETFLRVLSGQPPSIDILLGFTHEPRARREITRIDTGIKEVDDGYKI
jgi:hypothetical protein